MGEINISKDRKWVYQNIGVNLEIEEDKIKQRKGKGRRDEFKNQSQTSKSCKGK